MAEQVTPRAADDRLTPFGYKADPGRDFPKKSIRLMRTETLTVSAQIINQGGETNMHSHTNADEAWIVTAGRARFYGTSDDPNKKEEVVAELGPREGIVIPKGVPYWFESASDDQLEILRVSSVYNDIKPERVNYEPLHQWQTYLGGREPTESDRR